MHRGYTSIARLSGLAIVLVELWVVCVLVHQEASLAVQTQEELWFVLGKQLTQQHPSKIVGAGYRKEKCALF